MNTSLGEFGRIYADLCDTFGRTSDGAKFDRMVARLHLRFERNDPVVLRRAFEMAEEQEDRFPSLSRLLEFVRMENERRPMSAREATHCRTCGGSGTISARKNGYRYIFGCPDCSNSGANYPTWTDGRFSDGFSREVADGWDPADESQLKGLLLMGKDSMAWKNAPAWMQDAATRFGAGGWKPKPAAGGMASVAQAKATTPNKAVESQRRQNIRRVEQVESQEGCPF
jgi:hypothetical protein